jgi:hypothetical protein
VLPFDLDIGGCRWTTPGWGTGHLALQEIEEPSGCPGGYRRRRQRTAWAGCLQAPSALRHPVAGGMCLSLLSQHLLYLPCPIKAGQSMCMASISAKKPLVLAQPDLPILHGPLCGTSGDVALCYGPAHAQKLTCSCLTPWSYMRCRHKPARGSRA